MPSGYTVGAVPTAHTASTSKRPDDCWPPAAEPDLRLGDPLTVAHLRALLWIHRHREDLAARRAAVQAGRRRPDAEIFAKFPLRIVPTYPGDAQFDGAYFRTLLGQSPELVRSSLAEIFR